METCFCKCSDCLFDLRTVFPTNLICVVLLRNHFFLPTAKAEQPGKLYKHIEPHLKKALNTLYLGEVSR